MTRSVNDIALELGALKGIEDRIKALVLERKAELRAAVPRGTTYASIEGADKDGLATIVSTADSSSYQPQVVDEDAFIGWVIQNRPSAIVAAVRASDRSDILTQIAKTGEMPDGVEFREVESKGSVSVKQSPKQKQQLAEAWANGRLQPFSELLELEGGPGA
jgi:hypothetical protein